jgi:MFS transporter, Spinster family, sphingosine-1-phosphate transporter
MSIPDSSGPTTATAPERVSYAYVVLVILSLLNLLNYIDRFIFAALIPYIKQDTGYTDQQLGWVGSAFTIIYTVCSPLFGYLGDRYRRGRLLACGIAIWSLATATTGIAANFAQLLVSRAAVGIGEADYATIAPGLLADFFTKKRRGMVMSIFFTAIPIGTAIGYVLGGYGGAPERLGWRHTLYLVGLPGLLTALAAYTMREPQRGAMDHEAPATQGHQAEPQLTPIGWAAGYRMLFTNRGYLCTCCGYAAITFALGALVFWAPQWLKHDKGMTAEDANVVLGVCAVLGGLIGTMLGGLIADRLSTRLRGAYFWVCAASSVLAAPCTVLAIVSPQKPVYVLSIFLGITLVFLGNGPVNAVLVNLVPANLRTTALGLVVVIIHVLGDGISLPLVGAISTRLVEAQTALPETVVAIGQFFHLNPHTQTLSMALLLMPVAMLSSGALYALGLTTPEGKET